MGMYDVLGDDNQVKCFNCELRTYKIGDEVPSNCGADVIIVDEVEYYSRHNVRDIKIHVIKDCIYTGTYNLGEIPYDIQFKRVIDRYGEPIDIQSVSEVGLWVLDREYIRKKVECLTIGAWHEKGLPCDRMIYWSTDADKETYLKTHEQMCEIEEEIRNRYYPILEKRWMVFDD